MCFYNVFGLQSILTPYLNGSSQQRGRDGYPHFIEEKTEVRKGLVTCPGGEAGEGKNSSKIRSRLGFQTLRPVLFYSRWPA